ncbi:FapA family protein [Sporosarcina sp. YIM B06819]|uniref:DUF342 domain-containing protein n=1 Tax=Sporosarcina sp. YIM B06819 TaxID=3081769 RepID=UPI00298BECA4|nr:FapA family protein [Sporosarcina sp. YIM B06819]
MLIQNDYFDLFVQEEKVIVRSKKSGFPLKSFDAITKQFPRLKITSFIVLRKALTETDGEHIIGSWLPDFELFITADKMKAQLIINMATEEFEDNKQAIVEQVNQTLDAAGIIHGRKSMEDVTFKSDEPLIVAIGTEPEQGTDAIITYMEIPERKPVIREDGSADYYEMNFVTPVKEGDWLGEKIPPQKGIDGRDIYGNVISAQRGNDEKLGYDRKAIHEEEQDGKIVLRALHGGALENTHGILSVGKQLVISGDVGPETGSITFDGSVVVYGTVLAGYSVKATGDISIEGNEGVTNAKEIQSSQGDIYIKGGVFGGGLTIVEARGEIFIKHANNCKLYAKNVHTGLYLFGTEVIAECVFVDKNQGRIIGGHIEALFRIECAYAGNNHERTTLLYAKGIDKDRLYKEIQEMAQDLKNRQSILDKLEQHSVQFEKVAVGISGPQAEVYRKTKETIESNLVAIQELDKEIQLKMHTIKQAVPAQIEVTKEAYPGSVIQIGSRSTTLHEARKGVFEVLDGVLNV